MKTRNALNQWQTTKERLIARIKEQERLEDEFAIKAQYLAATHHGERATDLKVELSNLISKCPFQLN